MNLDIVNDLYFISVGKNEVFPSKIDCKEGEDPVEWLLNEMKQKPAKVVRHGLIIGEATGFDPINGKMNITYYDEPISVLTDEDWNEWAEENG